MCDHNHTATDTGKYAYKNIDLEYRDDVEEICDTFKDKSLFVVLPCKVGQTVYVDSRTLPTDKISLFNMGLYDDEMPKFFEGRIISMRKNRNGWYFKVAINTYWIEDKWDMDVHIAHKERYFTYPKGAIGITVFLTKEEAEQKLKKLGDGNG